jgi:hypothetical protein
VATKQKEIRVCDTCGAEIQEKTGFYCDDVHFEGYSRIGHKGKFFDVQEGKDYCSFDCLVCDIKKDLGTG